MSGGTYPPIDCELVKHDSPFQAETYTKNTVGNSYCKINDQDPPAEQVVEFTADTDNDDMVYAHAQAENAGGDIDIIDDKWKTNVELPAGTQDSRQFRIKQDATSTPTPATLKIKVYNSDYEINTNDPDTDVPDQATYWGYLDPELELR